jgi:YHS domain-containing protein
MVRIDPVCKTVVDYSAPNRHIYFGGKLFYFCSDTCKHRFIRMPFEFMGSQVEPISEEGPRVLLVAQ